MAQLEGKQVTAIKQLIAAYQDGVLKNPHKHEVHPGLNAGSKENYLYFSLVSTLNNQRNTTDLWESALNTYLDPETRYLFSPEKVVDRTIERIGEDMRKHCLSLNHAKDMDAWYKLSWTFYTHYSGDPKNILRGEKESISNICRHVQHDRQQIFPYLRNPRVTNYWLFILSKFTDVQFKDIYRLSMVVDKQVMKASEKLGITTRKDTILDIEHKWHSILLDMHISPVIMHDALYVWSKNDFTF